jgi:hypothetical protein
VLQLSRDVEHARRNVARFKAVVPEVQLVAGELRNTFGYQVHLRTTHATSKGYLRNLCGTFIVVSGVEGVAPFGPLSQRPAPLVHAAAGFFTSLPVHLVPPPPHPSTHLALSRSRASSTRLAPTPPHPTQPLQHPPSSWTSTSEPASPSPAPLPPSPPRSRICRKFS